MHQPGEEQFPPHETEPWARMRSWTDWRDRCDWEVFLRAVSGRKGDGAAPSSSRDRLVFRGRLDGRPVTLATPYPEGKRVHELTDYELQWYLDEALSRFLEPGRP